MPDTPEQIARRQIDDQLTACGWVVRHHRRRPEKMTCRRPSRPIFCPLPSSLSSLRPRPSAVKITFAFSRILRISRFKSPRPSLRTLRSLRLNPPDFQLDKLLIGILSYQ